VALTVFILVHGTRRASRFAQRADVEISKIQRARWLLFSWRLSVCLSVCVCVCPENFVQSLTPTIIARSRWNLHTVCMRVPPCVPQKLSLIRPLGGASPPEKLAFWGPFSKTISSLSFAPILKLVMVLQTSGQYLKRLEARFYNFDLVFKLLDFEDSIHATKTAFFELGQISITPSIVDQSSWYLHTMCIGVSPCVPLKLNHIRPLGGTSPPIKHALLGSFSKNYLVY